MLCDLFALEVRIRKASVVQLPLYATGSGVESALIRVASIPAKALRAKSELILRGC